MRYANAMQFSCDVCASFGVNLGGGVASPATAKQAHLTNLRVSHFWPVTSTNFTLNK